MSKQIVLTVNSSIKEELSSKGINLHDGIGYLVCLYYGIDPSYIPEALKRKVLATNILTKDFSNGSIVWKINLFEETIKGYEWIKEWMDMFKTVNPARRGTKSYVLKRMKKFFINNPEIRKDDVMKATKRYLESIDNPVFCKSSHKFIYEGDGSSMLESYVELVKDEEGASGRMVI